MLKVAAFIRSYEGEKGSLISILQDIQAEYHYLPREALELVARTLKIPLTRVYAVATFYTAFSLKPRGKHMIHLCLGTACHVKGAGRILEHLQNRLGISSGETTSDKQFSLEKVRCLGCCSLSPVMAIDRATFGHLTTEGADKIFKKYVKNK